PQDNIRLLNNLVKPSSVNRCNETDSTISNGSRAGAYSINYASDMSQKNFNADLTNPNIYHSIEDPTKEDHVYDEIKHKEEYKDIEKEYDHLDYARPGSSFKAHYHRMANSLSPPKETNLPKVSNIPNSQPPQSTSIDITPPASDNVTDEEKSEKND
uniref:Uncharacterized protein n=2 Tax=Phlebotomus papatasi TaxID=29031 RepID=A0A1B0D7J3_PHLPP